MSKLPVTPSPATIGIYGKLASLGDFASRGLPRSFIDPWDNWLQDLLSNLAATSGSGWPEIYAVSPIWHFYLPVGVCGPQGVLGVIMPSADRVGRLFPMTAVALFDQASATPTLLSTQSVWLFEVEALLLRTLAPEQLSPDAVQAELLALPAPLPGPVASFQGRFGRQCWMPSFASEDRQGLTLPTDILSCHGMATGHLSLWQFRPDPDRREGILITMDGLPTPPEWQAMLAGRPDGGPDHQAESINTLSL